MAIEYIYFDHDTIDRPAELKKFKGLSYQYEKWSCDEGTVEILNPHGEQVAFFRVKPDTCYVLQRRNQSALQLHEVTPPRILRERIPWLFGFGGKHRCGSRDELEQVCQEYRTVHPDVKVIVRDLYHAGSYLTYAYAVGKYTTPVAYYCIWGDGIPCFVGEGESTTCEFIIKMYRDLNFKYPLQFVVHQVKAMAMLYPMGTKQFFHGRLGIYDNDLYYADEYGGF